MKTIRRLLTALAICVAGLVVVAPNAGAAPAADGDPASIQSDGALHLYRGLFLTDQCGAFRGDVEGLDYDCYWAEESLWNNGDCGHALPDVWVYADALMYGPARRGVYCGVAILNLQPYTFDAGTGVYAGYSLYHHIGALEWTNLPG